MAEHSIIEPQLPLILQQSSTAESRCLRRLSVMSMIAHGAALAILLTWTGKQPALKPPVQVITIDLSQLEKSPPAPVVTRQHPVAPAPKTAVPKLPPAKPVPVPTTVTAPAVAPAVTPAMALQVAAAPVLARPPVAAIAANDPPAVSSSSVQTATKQTLPVAAPAVAAARPADHASVRAGYMQHCRRLIERHKEYPVMARKGRTEGTVIIIGTLARDGSLRQCSIHRSSGSSLLDNAALRAVRSVGQFPAFPSDLPGNDMGFEVPISFRLTSG